MLFRHVVARLAKLHVRRMSDEDINKNLDELARESGQTHLNHRESVVDRCKLLGFPDDLQSRIELAKDLGYKGKLDADAEMNTWMVKEMGRRFASGEFEVSIVDAD